MPHRQPQQTDEAPPPAGPTTQEGIPPDRAERDRIRRAIRDCAAAANLRAPLSLRELHEHSGRLVQAAGAERTWRSWMMVLLNNEAWRPRLAEIPYERRLLLLPQCLRDADACMGTIDELGLLCKGCGRCVIHPLKTEAERLGYVTLISEGTAAVLALVQSGKVDGFVGSSCMSTLEKVFPVMSVVAVPAIAVPLLRGGCVSTALDVDWLMEAIHLVGPGAARGEGRP